MGLSVPVTVRDVLAYFHLCGSLGGWWCGGLDVNIISGRGELDLSHTANSSHHSHFTPQLDTNTLLTELSQSNPPSRVRLSKFCLCFVWQTSQSSNKECIHTYNFTSGPSKQTNISLYR